MKLKPKKIRLPILSMLSVGMLAANSIHAQNLPIALFASAHSSQATASNALPIAPIVVAHEVPLPLEQLWTLQAGVTIGQNLQSWAEKSGWKVIWSLPKDWVVPIDTSYSGDFPTAAEKTIKTLSENGVLVHIGIFEGNKTAVISGPGQIQ